MRSPQAWAAIAVLGLTASGCAHGGRASLAPAPATTATKPPEDPTARLMAEANAHLASGLTEAKEGHLNRAREEFDRAVDVYLTAPGGAYTNPRLSEGYRRTLETVHLREIEALAAGDGFKENSPEPASIDEVSDLAVAEATPTDEARRAAQEAVQHETNDLPIELNNSVLSCINLYQGRLKDWFTEAMGRGARYLPQIRETFAAEGVPQDLAYVALVESAFKTGALSRAKAKGVWQFVSDTGRRYGLQQDWWVDERSDPEKATRAAAQYLKELYGMFGDWNLALASYNVGERYVAKVVTRYGTTDFWKLSQLRVLPRETRNYVPLILAAIVVAKAPGAYGFDITPEAAVAVEKVPIEGAVDLRLIAECAEIGVDQIRTLNPELRRLATPAQRTFPLKVPLGAAGGVSRCLDAVPPDKRVRFRTHVVARGESLYTIAKQYGTRTHDVAEANGIPLNKRLPVGTELMIPIDPVPITRAGREEPAVTTAGFTRINYRIQPGDTLAAIASQYGTTIRDLQSWNRLRDTRIAAGETLTIFTSRQSGGVRTP